MTDVVRRDIQRVWRQDCEDPGSEVRERWSIMLQPGNGAGYDQLTFLVPGLLRHETEARSLNLSSVFYLMSVRVELLLDQADKVPLDPRSIMPNKI